jgi:hypothetical protein
MTIDMCNNEPLNKFCWLSISTIHKWKKPPETDKHIALQGTIYGTSMYSRTDADNTRGDILDATNEGWCFKCAAIAGRIMLMRGDTINGAHARV